MCTHTYMYTYTYTSPAAHLCLQASDEDLEKQMDNIKKMTSMLVHHMGGSVQAKKRFEATIGG